MIRAFQTDNGPLGMSWDVIDESEWVATVATRREAAKLGATAFYTFEQYVAARVAGALSDDSGINIREVEPDGTRRHDEAGKPVVQLAMCGTCGTTWDDAVITSRTPSPGGLCPFEDEHASVEGPDRERDNDNGEGVTLAQHLADTAEQWFGASRIELDGTGDTSIFFEVQGFRHRYTVTVERQEG